MKTRIAVGTTAFALVAAPIASVTVCGLGARQSSPAPGAAIAGAFPMPSASDGTSGPVEP